MGNKIESLEHSSKNLKNNLMDLGIIPNISSKLNIFICGKYECESSLLYHDFLSKKKIMIMILIIRFLHMENIKIITFKKVNLGFIIIKVKKKMEIPIGNFMNYLQSKVLKNVRV